MCHVTFLQRIHYIQYRMLCIEDDTSHQSTLNITCTCVQGLERVWKNKLGSVTRYQIKFNFRLEHVQVQIKRPQKILTSLKQSVSWTQIQKLFFSQNSKCKFFCISKHSNSLKFVNIVFEVGKYQN